MLNRTFPLLLVACVVTGTLWAANDSFVGDWKLNPSKSKLTDVMKVESVGANKYTFNFGGGPQTIVVDGTDQPGGFGSTLSVAVEGPDTWKVIRKRNGHMTISATWNLSEDGSTLTDHFTGFNPNGSTYNVDYVYKRKAGGSGFEGEWVSTSETVNSVVLMQVRPYEGDGLSFVDPSAQVTRNVKFDGKDYPNLGPNVTPGATSSLRRVNERTLEMTYKISGKLLYTQQIELSSDSNTLTMTRHIVGESETNIRVFERAANDPFVGKWKVNPSKSKLNDEMKVEVAGANRYAITFAPGAVDTVVADGSDQPGLRGTTLSITVKGPNNWEVIRKMKGRTLLTAYWTLSEDGKTLNDAYTEYAPDGSTSSVPYVYERTAGSSGFLGTWDSESEKVKSGIELQIQPYEGDGLSFNSPDAEMTKKMKFDGNDYPDLDPDVAPGSASSGRRLNERSLEITDKFKGKITGTRQIELSTDLKTLTMTVRLVGQNKPKNILVFDRE